MRILLIDTAGPRCAVAVSTGAEDGARVIERARAMHKGHAEALLPMVAAVMTEAGTDWDRIDRIAAITGPGSFTGIRIGVAAARGLALAAGCPCVGISAFAAIHAGLAADIRPEPVAIILDARRDQVFMQVFKDGHAADEPAALSRQAAARYAAKAGALLTGSGADLLAGYGDFPLHTGEPVIRFEAFAKLAAGAAPDDAPATPLYLRPPDAKPQTGGLQRS